MRWRSHSLSGLSSPLHTSELTGGDLARIYTALERVDTKRVKAQLEALAIEAAVTFVRTQYEHRSSDVFPEHHVTLAAWLVASVGPATREATDFELALRREDIVAPRWVLAQPIRLAQHRRCPARPLAWPSDWERDDMDGWLRLAYEGLLEHLDMLTAEDLGSELSASAIQWRLVALVDGLMPERSDRHRGQTIASRLNELLRRTKDLSASTIEQLWVGSIDLSLLWRRHALTHLFCEPSDGGARWTFKRCVESSPPLNDLLVMSAGVSLAVMDSVAEAFRNEPDRYIQRLAARCESDAV
jgi:hypothetical protein